MNISRPLKILMFHGYKQNELMFRDKTGGLRKNLKNIAELVYCEAYHVVPNNDNMTDNINSSSKEEINEQEIEKCWYWKNLDVKFDFENGFKKTLDHINEIFKEKGPFDGIWGFSQGAEIVSILCNLLTSPNKTINISNVNFKFAIISATCQSTQQELDVYYDSTRKIDIPTLHIIGKTDKLVPYEKSLKLTEYFLNPKIFEHDLGHFIPAKKEHISAYVEFLQEIRNILKDN